MVAAFVVGFFASSTFPGVWCAKSVYQVSGQHQAWRSAVVRVRVSYVSWVSVGCPDGYERENR